MLWAERWRFDGCSVCFPRVCFVYRRIPGKMLHALVVLTVLHFPKNTVNRSDRGFLLSPDLVR